MEAQVEDKSDAVENLTLSINKRLQSLAGIPPGILHSNVLHNTQVIF